MTRHSKPVISIVLPVYNGERYLRDAVKSCLEQSFSDFELICVDDASTDGTPGILTEYAQSDARVHYVRHTENEKLPGALNTGFEMASGRYFTWTSDDNLYHPDALATMLSFLETNADVDLVYAGYRRIDEEGREIRIDMPPDPDVLFTHNIIGACFMYRRQVHDDLGGYRREMFLAEDYDFWLRAALRFRIQPLDEVLYTYRFHGAALGQTHPEGVVRARRACLQDVVDRASALCREKRARAHLSIAQASAILADTPRTRAHLLAALAARPLWTIGRTNRHTVATALLGADRAAGLRAALRRDRA